MNNIKVVFFDIDGTVFEHDISDLPKSTYVALKALKRKGIKLCACTSRVKAELINLKDEFINLCDGFIHSAGAVIEIKNQIYKMAYLNLEDTKNILNYCKENSIVARWASENINECYFDAYMDDRITGIWRYLYNMEPTYMPWDNRLIVHIDTFPDMNKIDEMRKLVSHTNVIELKETVEFTDKGISKGQAIKDVMDLWNLEKTNALAIGDGKNDIEMFKNVKISIAMGQAQETVKEAATVITNNIKDDGFYLAFVKLGLIEDELNLLNKEYHE